VTRAANSSIQVTCMKLEETRRDCAQGVERAPESPLAHQRWIRFLIAHGTSVEARAAWGLVIAEPGAGHPSCEALKALHSPHAQIRAHVRHAFSPAATNLRCVSRVPCTPRLQPPLRR